MEETCIMAHIRLKGDDFDTDKITEMLGIIPTEANRKNEMLKIGRLSKRARWGISTNWTPSREPEEVLNTILRPLMGKKKLMLQIAKENNACWEISFGIQVWNEKKPALYFSKETILTFAELEADLDIDYFCYGFEADEDHKH